jgi:hypothetical protein
LAISPLADLSTTDIIIKPIRQREFRGGLISPEKQRALAERAVRIATPHSVDPGAPDRAALDAVQKPLRVSAAWGWGSLQYTQHGREKLSSSEAVHQRTSERTSKAVERRAMETYRQSSRTEGTQSTATSTADPQQSSGSQGVGHDKDKHTGKALGHDKDKHTGKALGHDK